MLEVGGGTPRHGEEYVLLVMLPCGHNLLALSAQPPWQGLLCEMAAEAQQGLSVCLLDLPRGLDVVTFPCYLSKLDPILSDPSCFQESVVSHPLPGISWACATRGVSSYHGLLDLILTAVYPRHV